MPEGNRTLTIEDVRANITDPRRWVDPEHLLDVMRTNPSLRGFTYGYVAEYEFVRWLASRGIESHEHSKDDDHKKTKSDRTLRYGGQLHTIQLKSMQTNSIRQLTDDTFIATVQNDASDSRDILLPNGHRVHTTCYKAGEYEILGVSIQPFVGAWDFAFKRNVDLRRTTDKRYAPEDRPYLLATTERITWPLSGGWTTDLFSLLGHIQVAEAIVDGPDGQAAADEHAVTLVETDDANGSE